MNIPAGLKTLQAFIAQYYERILAVAVLLTVVVFAVGLVMRVSDLQNVIKREVEERPPPVNPTEIDRQPMKDAIELLKAHPIWSTNSTHRLFIAPKMVVDPKTYCPIPPRPDEEEKNDGVTLKWLREHGLSPKINVHTDPDGDGFDVKEEYEFKTHPNDPKSHPEMVLKLRVVKVTQKSFPFRFVTANEGAAGVTFDIRRVDDNRKVYYVKIGAVIPDKTFIGWKVVGYEKKINQVPNPRIKGTDGKPIMENVDVSEVTLQKEGGDPKILIRNVTATTEELYAQVYFIPERRTFEIGQGEFFLLQDVKYQVIKIKKLDDGKLDVIVKPVNGKKEISLKMIRSEETQAVLPPGQTAPGEPSTSPEGSFEPPPTPPAEP